MNGNSNVAQRSTDCTAALCSERGSHFDLPRVSTRGRKSGGGERDVQSHRERKREMASGQKGAHTFIYPPVVQPSTPLGGGGGGGGV